MRKGSSILALPLTVAGLTAGIASDNQPPRILDITVDPTPSSAGQTVTVLTTASDPEGQVLTYIYSTSQGTLNGAADQDATVDWVLPASEGDFVLNLVIQDSQGGIARAERHVSIGTYYPSATLTGALRQPARLALGGAGDVWVTDAARRRVVHLGPGGTVLSEFICGPRPLGIARLDANSLLVGEDGLDRVARYSNAGSLQSIFATGVQMPSAIAITPSGTIHVVDSRAGLVRTFSVDGAPGPTYGAGGVIFPVDLAISADGGEVFVADQSAAQIKVFDSAGILQRTLGSRGSGPGQFMRLEAVALADGGRVLALDSYRAAIQVMDAAGGPIATFGQFGAWPGALRTPLGLATVPGDGVFATSSGPGEIEVFAAWAALQQQGLFIR